MSNKSKVKSYVRKGKVVNSYERNNKKRLRLTALAGIGGLGAGGVTAYKLLKNNPNIDVPTKASLGTYGALGGLVLGATVGSKVGNRIFLTKEQREERKKKELAQKKLLTPYIDKDLSGIAGALDLGKNSAIIGGVGSLTYGMRKLNKAIKKKYPDRKVAQAINNIEPAVLGRYGKRMLKPALKTAVIAGLAGATIGYLSNSKKATKLNKELGREDRTKKENRKERITKIAKGVGAAAIGIGVGSALGYGITKSNMNNPVYKESMKKLDGVFASRYKKNEIVTNAKLRQAGNQLVDEYKMLQHRTSPVKLLTDGRKIPNKEYDVLREQIKRKGERIGKGIRRSAINNNKAISNLESIVKSPKLQTVPLMLAYGGIGGTLGVTVYNNKRNKKYKK